MEQKMIEELLTKYFEAETTVEEERLLAAYLSREDIELPVEWEGYRQMFSYYKSASDVTMGPVDLDFMRPRTRVGSVRSRLVRHSPWWAAAAVILISLGVMMVPRDEGSVGRVVTGPAVSVAEIGDTYDDPEKALAAIRKALYRVSSKMEQGTDLTKKELHHFNQINHAIGN